jgi:ribosome biogenesis GTPase A
MSIGWYPGHMHKARKEISESLQQVDAVIEIVDARLPYASENPLLNKLIGDKPRVRLLCKADLADPVVSARWLDFFQHQGISCLLFEKEDTRALREVLRRATAGLERKASRSNRVMIVGIPNVGKSTLINLLAGRKIAKVGNEPAVTKARQEIKLSDDLSLLDTPGILWPKLEDQQAAYRLAASGAIRNTAIELGDVGLFAVELLQQRYPLVLKERYQLDAAGSTPLTLLENIGKKRGCLTKSGVDLTKAGEVVLNDLRSGKLGRISLETPEDIPQPPVSAVEGTRDEG